MSGERKRTPAELWQALERMTEEVELERIDSLSDEELDREVRAAGLDPQALDRAIGSIVLFPSDEPLVRPPRDASRRSGRASGAGIARDRAPSPRRLLWIVGLAFVAIVASVTLLVVARQTLGHAREPMTAGQVSRPAPVAPAD